MVSNLRKVKNIIALRIKGKYKELVSWIYKKLPLYYKSLKKIPFDRWYEVQGGKLEYLNKRDVKIVPYFFYSLYVNMIYEMPVLDNENLRKRADMQILYSMAARTGDKGILFKADALKKELEIIDKQNEELNRQTVDQVIDLIEISGIVNYQIDPTRTSASRVYSLYDKAKKKLKKIEQLRKKQNVNHTK
jgi:uncharacterized protein YjgD (DUF1641 family)